MLTKKNYQSPLGEITLLSDETYLLGVWFKEQKYFAANYDLNQAKEDKSLPIINAIDWLDAYFKGENPDLKKIKLINVNLPFPTEPIFSVNGTRNVFQLISKVELAKSSF